ncbi:RimJ/RimL family protein N-acetyltransferase [Salsuginibacillus halophilus]|uniref:RimJ/RimL family protein N-acetyltransferase n=1 Tax=Salsuginibacillus halophilus TaxID=517424 RepID=A0A2P8H9R9_9BACI|nr:GNAT family protein [Salsuginibacillus halophilus]PSL42919.1 RimJ/RimL family protein N-acetyltransferase [Salsuginibacillus halophilus]
MNLTFVEFEEKHFETLMSWVTSEAFMMQWSGTTFSYPLTKEQLRTYQADREARIYMVYDIETNAPVGHIALSQISETHERARIGKVLVGEPAMRGRGVGRMMIEHMLNEAFQELGLHRVSLGVLGWNEAALNAYEHMGFHSEGFRRDVVKFNGERYGAWEMSMLRPEWEEMNNERNGSDRKTLKSY